MKVNGRTKMLRLRTEVHGVDVVFGTVDGVEDVEAVEDAPSEHGPAPAQPKFLKPVCTL